MSSGMRRLVLMVGAAVLTMRGAVAQAGPAYPLGRKAVCAGAAVEVELQVPKARGGSAPNRARERAMARARVTATFYGTPAADLPRPLDFYLRERTWKEAEKRGHLRAIVFAGRPTGAPSLLFGVEGQPADVDPDYVEVRAAVLRYAHWRDRRHDPAVLAGGEKTLATTANQSIASLAWTFLCSSGHGDATARAAKLAPPSSPAATMTKDHDVCQPKLECRDW